MEKKGSVHKYFSSTSREAMAGRVEDFCFLRFESTGLPGVSPDVPPTSNVCSSKREDWASPVD